MEIVRENELSDKVVVLHGRIEDVIIEEKVDVIVSEWMGSAIFKQVARTLSDFFLKRLDLMYHTILD